MSEMSIGGNAISITTDGVRFGGSGGGGGGYGYTFSILKSLPTQSGIYWFQRPLSPNLKFDEMTQETDFFKDWQIVDVFYTEHNGERFGFVNFLGYVDCVEISKLEKGEWFGPLRNPDERH